MRPRCYRIGTCGLSMRDDRVVGIVLAHAASSHFHYEAADGGAYCDIVLVEPDNADAAAQLREVRARNPQVIAVALSDATVPAGVRHRVARRTLWSRLIATLDDVAQNDLGARAQGRDRPDAAVAAADVPLATDRHLRALVLDDKAPIRAQLQVVLSRRGIRSDVAADWEAAARLLDHGSYDLVFVDAVMPGVDGYEACRRIRRRPESRRLPVVMLTSLSSAFDRARGALAGCDAYLVKPIDLQVFHTTIGKIVAGRRRDDSGRAEQHGFLPVPA